MKIRVKSKSKKTVKPSKKMADKTESEKPAKKPTKKVVAKGKINVKKPIKSKKKTEEQKQMVSKKPAVRKVEKEKKPAPRKKAAEKAIKKAPKKSALPAKKIARIPQRTIKKIRGSNKVFAPLEYGVAVTAKKGLPGAYGKDRITLMTVDPWKLFAYWEVREDTLSKVKGMLVLRVYDVTGIYFDGKNANLVFDIHVHGKIGDSYMGVGPGKTFIVDIGAVSKKGEFVTAARSNQASTPTLKVAKEEGALPQEIYEVGAVTGYF